MIFCQMRLVRRSANKAAVQMLKANRGETQPDTGAAGRIIMAILRNVQ